MLNWSQKNWNRYLEKQLLVQTQSNWEKYYSTLKRIPRRLKETAQFVTDALPALKQRKIRRMLDLGCGAGRHCILLAQSGFDVIGIDISKNALHMARKWVRKEKLRNVALVHATMTNLPLIDCCLDAVISVSVMHHALKKDIVKSVSEVYRILNKNGWLLANLASVKDPRYRAGQKIEPNTYRILEAFEEKRFEELHHFFTKQETLRLTSLFSETDVTPLKDKPNYWKILAVK
jgi:ubiquinone/menaquinone biosynthesis C-methylase UbiE